MSSQEQYSIPSELQETLLDVTVHYLVERPPDIIDFAMDYFGELQNKRNGGGNNSEDDEDMESEDDIDFGEYTFHYLHDSQQSSVSSACLIFVSTLNTFLTGDHPR